MLRQASLLAARARTMSGFANSVTELIGRTPMVRLNRVTGEKCVAANVLVKLEMQNPGGSVKDRIALSMIEEAEKRGDIAPGRTTIVEATSGNTGERASAAVAAVSLLTHCVCALQASG